MGENLISILYVSSMCKYYTPAEIDIMVKSFQESNKKHNVSGMLVYSSGNIMQYIEGEKATIDKLYDNIKKDRRHECIITLVNENIQSRIFEDWSLNYKMIDLAEYTNLLSEDNIVKIKILNNFIRCNK